jgi:NHL repeat
MRKALCIAFASLVLAAPAQGASDPLFVFTPSPPPPPTPVTPPPMGNLNGPCGLAVDSLGRFYVSDYHHHAVDVFSPDVNISKPWEAYVTQVKNVDPLDGPCGLALDSSNQLFVNNYHRNITRYNAAPSFGTGTIFPLPAEDTARHLPTGVAVDTSTNRIYVNHRTYVSVLDSSGTPVLDGGEPLKIGVGSLGDGYGVAVSQFPATTGRLYVPDAQSNTVKVYDPVADKVNPVATIKNPVGQSFVSLRNSAVAIDRVNGDVYFADNLQPKYTERPQASIYVYSSVNVYKGRLKYNVIDALPPGLAVDNSVLTSQGRVYVTSGDSSNAAVYAYGPGSATFATPLPPLGSGLQPPGSSSGTGPALSAGEAPRPGARSSFVPEKEGPPATTSVITQENNLRVNVEGKLSPKKLPREGSAPISVQVGWDISTVDGSPPPKLKTLTIEINREGRFETNGLPTCPYAKIHPASTKRALSNCRSALVGRGSFEANIALKGQEGESYAARGQLLLFNGLEKGKPVLYGQIYSAHPFATSFVIVFAVERIKKGSYGTALTATLPASLRSWGDLTAIEMKLERRYGYEGKQRSYISAGCPAPKGFGLASFKLARTSFSFTGGEELSSTVAGDCRVR